MKNLEKPSIALAALSARHVAEPKQESDWRFGGDVQKGDTCNHKNMVKIFSQIEEKIKVLLQK